MRVVLPEEEWESEEQERTGETTNGHELTRIRFFPDSGAQRHALMSSLNFAKISVLLVIN